MRTGYEAAKANPSPKSFPGNILAVNHFDARIWDDAPPILRFKLCGFNKVQTSMKKEFVATQEDLNGSALCSPVLPVVNDFPPQGTQGSTESTFPAPQDVEAFAWTYFQQTGELQHDGQHVTTGYSGAGTGKNNPAMESVPNVGPIPRGDWTITGPPASTNDHGPYVLRLTPAPNTETFGRSGFLIHGDSKQSPGSASQGCVVVPRAAREEIWNSGDRDLTVVSEIFKPPQK